MNKSTRYLLIPALLVLEAAVFGGVFVLSAASESATDTGGFVALETGSIRSTTPAGVDVLLVQESATQKPLFKVVRIRISSSRELKRLRAMNLDIVRIRSDSDRAEGHRSDLKNGYTVEAVVTRGELAKLEKLGFDVVEISEQPE